MNLQQMRYLTEVVRHGLRISAAARAMNTSQPAVTKQLLQLERELGTSIFVRERRRIVKLTSVGRRVAKLAQNVCFTINSIKQIGEESSNVNEGRIRIAATHSQARFVLPAPMQLFTEQFAHIHLDIVRARPAEIVPLVASGEVSFGVTPDADPGHKEVVFRRYRSYSRVVLAPRAHPINKRRHISLAMLAEYPIITTGPGIARTEVIDVFREKGIEPDIHLTATDFDVVKVCVERELGIAILPAHTYDRHRDKDIRAIDVGSLFPPSITSIVLRKNRSMSRAAEQFLNMLLAGAS